MKHREVTHRTVEIIIFWVTTIMYFIAAGFGVALGFPKYALTAIMIMPLIGGIFTVVPPLRGNLQAYAVTICMETAITAYALNSGTISTIHGVFLAAICLTALYQQIGLVIAQMIYVTLLYMLVYVLWPDMFFARMVMPSVAIYRIAMFYIGCIATIMLLMWFKRAIKIAQNRNEGISDLLKVVEQQKIQAEAGTKEKSDFLANMSHEMRTPMIAVCGMSELLLQNDLTPLEEEYVTTIKNSANNLLSLVNDILDFSKIDAGMMSLAEEPYNIESLIAEVANIINVRIGESEIAFVVEIDANVPKTLIGDEVRIRQILINLLNNAVKYTEKGLIKLKVSYRVDELGKSWLTAAVYDTGIGISNEDQKRLFMEFTQVDNDKNRQIQGTGLGLIISKRLANMMNGNLTMESKLGEGSVFTVFIEQKVKEYKEIAVVPDSDGFVAYLYEPNEYYSENFKAIMSQLGVAVINVGELKLWDYYNADQYGGILFFDYASGIESVNSFALKVKRMRIVAMIDRNSFVDINIKSNILMIHKPLLTGQLAALVRGENLDIFCREKKNDNDLFIPSARVMVVDDNYVNLKVVEGLLNVYKPQITLVSSGRDAYHMLESYGRYDIIFMDQMMPDWDGLETVRHIRSLNGEYYKTVPIIALSANNSENSREMFLENGMNDFVEKPVSINALHHILKKYISADKQVSEYSEPTDPMMTRNRPISSYNSEDDSSGSSAEIKGVDMAKGIFNMGGSKDAYNHILNVVLEDGRQKVVYLEKYAEEGNMNAYRIETHALRSVAASIGADALSSLAEQHEKASDSGDMEFVEGNYRELINSYCEILRNIENYLTAANVLFPDVENIKEVKGSVSITPQMLHNTVIEVNRLIDLFDSDRAIEKLGDLLNCSLDKTESSAIRKAINQLNDYMFDEAKQTLSSL